MKRRTTALVIPIATMAIMSGLCTFASLADPTRVGAAQSAYPAILPADISREFINRESEKYTRAVREISSISTGSLKSDFDLMKAIATINAQARNLRLIRYRLIQIALEDAAFTRALDQEFTKGGNADEVLKRFRTNPSRLTILSGFQLRRQITELLKRDYEAVRTVAGTLETAANERFKRRQPNAVSGTDAYSESSSQSLFNSTLYEASQVVARAQRAITELPRDGSGTDSTAQSSSDQQAYQDCVSKADASLSSCAQACTPGLLELACKATCTAVHLIAIAQCAFK